MIRPLAIDIGVSGDQCVLIADNVFEIGSYNLALIKRGVPDSLIGTSTAEARSIADIKHWLSIHNAVAPSSFYNALNALRAFSV